MVNINIDQKIKDQNGKVLGEKMTVMVIRENSDEVVMNDKGVPLLAEVTKPEYSKTLKDVITESLLFEKPNSQLTPEDKSKRYSLWYRVNKEEKSIDLSAEEILLIKECIANLQPILIMGQCHDYLENKNR